MILSDQVCSLELAKRLKELGVKQESYFYYAEQSESDWKAIHLSRPWNNTYSAFTVAELFALLPHRITLPEGAPYNLFRLRVEKGIWCRETITDPLTYFYSVNYLGDTTSQEMDWMFRPMMQNITDEIPANAFAKMLAYLLENKLYEIT